MLLWNYLLILKNFPVTWTESGDFDTENASRIRIHMFLGLPDPDPLVRGMDPDPDLRILIRILLSSCKNSKKNLDFFYFVTLFDFFLFEKWYKCTLKTNKQKKLC